MIQSTIKGLYKSLFLTAILSSSTTFLIAQNALDTYYQQGDLVYEDHIYKAGIRSIQFHPEDDPLEMPIIKLYGDRRLLLQFDDLFEDYVDYSYRVIHCNADWTPSALLPAQYLSNFQDFIINRFAYSANALIPYTNYQLSLPNDQVQMTKSGNYLLVVYANGDKQDLVFSRRFMVYEDFVAVGGEVRRSSLVENFNTHQEVDFTLSHPNYVIQNPFQDLQVILMQNQRWDNAIRNLKPRFLQNSQLVYNYDRENNFSGINEYRFFDIKNVLNLGQHVANIKRDSVYTVFIKQDFSKAIDKYVVWPDINGQYVIRRLDAGDNSTESDYVYVDFQLVSSPLEQGDIYLFGKFTDFKMLPEYKLQYDYKRGLYKTRILLKQGYYNYAYAMSTDGNYAADLSVIEGEHWETENDYQILVYNREVGIRYDRLVGFGRLNSDDLY